MNLLKLDKEPKLVEVAVPAPVQVDPSDSGNCFTESWENRTGAPNRCLGIDTILDTDELVCGYFASNQQGPFSLGIDSSAVLYSPNGDRARWGQKGPVKRCNACLVGEQIMTTFRKTK